MLTRHSVAFCMFVVLPQLIPTRAADGQALRVDSARVAAVAYLEVDTRIRIAFSGRDVAEGIFVRATSDSLHLHAENTMRSLALIELDSLWVARSSVGLGAISGAGAGGILFGILGAIVSTGTNSANERCNCPQLPAAAAVVGVGVGALIGAMVGALHTDWERRYP